MRITDKGCPSMFEIEMTLCENNGSGIEFVNIQDILERFTHVNLPIQLDNLTIFWLDY